LRALSSLCGSVSGSFFSLAPTHPPLPRAVPNARRLLGGRPDEKDTPRVSPWHQFLLWPEKRLLRLPLPEVSVDTFVLPTGPLLEHLLGIFPPTSEPLLLPLYSLLLIYLLSEGKTF